MYQESMGILDVELSVPPRYGVVRWWRSRLVHEVLKYIKFSDQMAIILEMPRSGNATICQE